VKAQDLLEKFPAKSKDLFYYQAQDLLGQVYMKQEKYDEALAVYEKILVNPEVYTLDVVYFHMAELFEKKGDTEKALDYYKKIQDEFAQSYYAYDAASEIRKLEGKK
jgi:tetratricopeptide (TPR) repeat protein